MNKNNKKLLCLAIVAMFAMVGTVYVAADADQSDATTSFTCAVGYYFGETLAYSTNFGNTNVSASGLPPGLSFNPANGYLDGYPTTAGTYTVVASGSGETTTYSITITSTFTYTVVFNANGGSGGPGTVNYTCSDGAASYITIPSTTPSRSGYTFIGWASAAVAPGPEVYPGNNLSVSGPGTTTFYALWQVVTVTTYTHTLNYNANGGTNAPSTVTITNTSVNYGITVTTLQPTRSGYIYAGWSTSASATTATYSGGSTVTVGANSSVTLYAVWTLEAPSEYTLTLEYDANGGEGAPAAQSTTSATTSHDFIISSTTPTRSGYTFLGWSVNASATTATYVGGDTRAVLATGGAGSGTLILYAVWNEIGLTTISFNANGGEGNIVDMSVLTGNSINLPTFGFTKDGYYLSSWALGSATGTTYSLGSSYSVTGTVTFYAKWTAIPSDNDLMAPTIAPVGTLYRYIPEAEDNVWTVIKETITSGSIQSSSFPTWMTTHTITYNTLEFAGTPTSSDIGVHIVSLTVRASNGYTCSVSWIVTVSDPSEGSIYTISFVANGGTGTVSSQYGIESSAIELPNNTTAAITKTGYSLGGWSTTIDGTSVIYPLGSIYTVHSDKTFSAVWVADTYVVVFDVNGGTGETAYQTATTDGLVSLPSDGYTKSGYALLGWYRSSDPSTIYALGYQYTVSATTVFKAYWVATGTSTINVTFNANGGTGGFTQTVESGKNIVLPVYGINYAGKILSGWNTAANGSGTSYDLGSHISITSAKTIYAEWDESTSDTIMITFSLNGGQGSISPIITTKDSTISKPTDPTRFGYIFNGWRIVGGADFNFTTIVNANMTLEAKWTQMFTTAINGTTVTVTLTPAYQAGSTTITWGDGHTSTGTRSSFEYDYGMTSSGVIVVSISLAGDTYASSMNYSVTSSTPAPNEPTPDPIVDNTSGSTDNTMTIIIAIIVVAAIGFLVTRVI